ncbi:MAG: hypothetical protein HY062_13585 [Bacteroidetes bacterium]|nr:hypothetical protein [Bacteroidota bacterium]
MKYSVYLFVSCLVGLLLSCSHPQESNEPSLSLKGKSNIIAFIPDYLSETPEIILSKGKYNNYSFKNYIIDGLVDSNNLKQGAWVINDISNKFVFRGYYLNNNKIGWWSIIEGAKLICCGNYSQNKKQGFWRYLKLYTGTLKFVTYFNDTLTDLAREYSADSVLLSDGKFRNGLKDGYWKFYFGNGNLKEQGYFQDNTKSGWWQSYDLNNKLLEEASYSRDEISGYVKRYLNGILSEEGKQFNGRRRGAWKFYDSEGNIKKITEYDE